MATPATDYDAGSLRWPILAAPQPLPNSHAPKLDTITRPQPQAVFAESQPASDPAMELNLRAWRAQYRNLREAVALGQRLATEGDTPAGRAAGACHMAFALLRLGERDAGENALAQAWTLARADNSVAALAACRNAQALLLRRQKKPEQALHLLLENLAQPLQPGAGTPGTLIACIRCVNHNLAALTCSELGQLDDALRHYLTARDEAQRSGDAALLANASANLSGVQADLLNLEDAAALADEAIAAAEHAGLAGEFVWLTASYNRCYTALSAGQGSDAQALAQRMRVFAANVPAQKRARYELLWATAAVAVGELADATRLLARSRRRWTSDDDLLLEWSVVHAALDNGAGRLARGRASLGSGAVGRARIRVASVNGEARIARDRTGPDDGTARFTRARAVCDAARDLTTSGGEEALPQDRMRLFEQASLACEALGDTAAALSYARLAFAQYERVAGRSARARRVTAEAQLSLQLERRSHEEAVRRHQAAEEEQLRLAELNHALHAANLAKTRFLAAASHDLRQPLHALALQSANLRAALAEPTPAAAAATAERLEQNVLALSAMFDALLDISLIESGGLQARRAAVPLRPLLLRLVEDLQPEAESRGLRLALRLPASAASMQVDTDPALLETMLRNLLSNALKYTEGGGVMLALRRLHSQPGRWQLQVIDTGIGIEPAWQQKVFEDFVQVGNPQRQRSQGLGLGLAIVQRLAALLAHPVRLRSRPGRGTCVSLQLDALAAPHGSELQVIRSLSGCRVAVVEDDPEALRALVELLHSWQIETLQADRASVLLQAMAGDETRSEATIDALITDLRLPGAQDGVALAQALRAQPRLAQLPVLVVTADSVQHRLPQFDWLIKPVTAMALFEWLQRTLPAR